MRCRVVRKCLLSLYGPVDLLRWDLLLLDNSVGNHGYGVTVEEVEKPVIDPTQSHAEFVNAVSQVVRFGSAKFVAQLLETGELQSSCPFCAQGEATRNRFGWARCQS